jgi:hypothetical protein
MGAMNMINNLNNRAYAWTMATLVAMLGVVVLLIQHARDIGDAWQWARWVALALVICAALYTLYRFFHQASMHKLDREHKKAITKTLVMPHELEIKRLELEKMRIQLEHDRLVIDAAKVINPKGEYISAQIDMQQNKLPAAPAFPAMSYMLSQGYGSKGIPLCWTQDGPLYGTLEDLLSVAMVGLPRSGKSTYIMYLICCFASIGAEVVVWDIHGMMGELKTLNGQRLANMPETARITYHDSEDLIIESLQGIHQEIETRDAYYKANTRAKKHPFVLLADEMPRLSAINKKLIKVDAPSLSELFGRLVNEAAKWNMSLIAGGQFFRAEILPCEITQNMATKVAFHCEDENARQAGISNKAIKEYMETIQASPAGIMLIQCPRLHVTAIGAVPFITPEMMAAFLGVQPARQERECVSVASIPASFAASNPCKGSEVYTPLPTVYHAEEATHTRNTTPLLSEREMKVCKMLEAGISRKQIIQEIWHVSGGRYYAKANEELAAIITKIIEMV